MSLINCLNKIPGFSKAEREAILKGGKDYVRSQMEAAIRERNRLRDVMFQERADDARNANIVDIDPAQIPVDTNDTRTLARWLLGKYNGKTVQIRDDGTIQRYQRSGLESGAKRRGDEQRATYADLSGLLENAMFDHFEPSDGQEKHTHLEGQRVYYAAMRIGGKLYSVKFKLDVSSKTETSAYKDHKVTEIDIAPALSAGRAGNGGYLPANSGAISKVSMSVLRGEVNPSSTDSGLLFQTAPMSDKEAYQQANLTTDAFAPTELNILSNSARSPFERSIERFREGVQDEHVTLRRILQLAGIASENLRLDTMGALDRLSSKLQHAQETLALDPFSDIQKVLEKAYPDAETAIKDLDDLLIAEHVAEYNAYISEINPARYDANDKYEGGFDAEHPGSGIKDEDAQNTIKRLTEKNDAKSQALREAQKIYREMINKLQDYAIETGLEKPDVVEAWRQRNPNYVPFQRNMETEDNFMRPISGGAGFSLRAGVSRNAMGSAREIICSAPV